MRLHERYFLVQKAEGELKDFYLKWLQEHDLTYLETLRILNSLMADDLKYAIRQERHGDDTDTKGDEA